MLFKAMHEKIFAKAVSHTYVLHSNSHRLRVKDKLKLRIFIFSTIFYFYFLNRKSVKEKKVTYDCHSYPA